MLEEVKDILSKTLVEDIIIYNLEGYSPFYDYFVVGTVASNRQGAAVINYLKKDIRSNRIRFSPEKTTSGWYLIDLGDIVVHIFTKDARREYDIDSLYNQLPKEII